MRARSRWSRKRREVWKMLGTANAVEDGKEHIVVVLVVAVVVVVVVIAGRRWNRWMFDFQFVWSKI
jgi:hypothetical protein